MSNWVLYTWGVIPFEVYPLNVENIQHSTETDWAHKEIAGAAMHYEWVGENPEEVVFRGRVFPEFFAVHSAQNAAGYQTRNGDLDRGTGGLWHLDVMDNMRRLGQVHVLVRGDGWHLGWFGIRHLRRGHSHIGANGVGKMIEFEVEFQRFPVPYDPAAYFPMFWGQMP